MKNYIFGTGNFAIESAKRLQKFGIKIDAFINVRDINKNVPNCLLNNIPVFMTDEKINIDIDSRFFLAKKPMFMGNAIDYLRKNNYKNIYIINEMMFFKKQNSIDELFEYIDKIDLDKPFLNYLEINLVDQCNLNCKGCAHFSNICNNHMVSIEQFENDLKKITDIFNLYSFRLLGGEPLLHPNLKEIIEISRKYLNDSMLTIVTNGLLIDKLNDDILKAISENNVIISISLYKPTYKKLSIINEILKKYNIKYLLNDDIFRKTEPINKFHTRLSTTKQYENNQPYERCSGRFCRFLNDGKIAKCYYPLLIHYLNEKYNFNFQINEGDYIYLKDIDNGWDAIDEMNKPIPFCGYCREYLDEFNWESNHKNDKDGNSYVLKQSYNLHNYIEEDKK